MEGTHIDLCHMVRYFSVNFTLPEKYCQLAM